MITIDLGNIEYYDEKNNEFIYRKGGIVRFEYSLKVIYEWEGKWCKPFLKGELSNQELTNDELVDFYMKMALDPIEKEFMTDAVMDALSEYIKKSHTATTFSSVQDNNTNKGKTYTSEELYALMISDGVPLEFENRNLNRLLVVLRIISSYKNPPKKMSNQDIYRQNASLNAKRKAMLKSKG